MSDRATMYRLAQENNVQSIMDLFDMVVDEYTKNVERLHSENYLLRARAEKAEADLAALHEQTRWIPVSERFPKTRSHVIVCFKSEFGKQSRTPAIYIAPRTVLAEDFLDEDYSDGFAEYDEKEDQFWTPAGFYEFQFMAEVNYFIHEEVTHWMPLPAGLQEGEE